MWKCNNCGGENGDASSVCASCGDRRGTTAKVVETSENQGNVYTSAIKVKKTIRIVLLALGIIIIILSLSRINQSSFDTAWNLFLTGKYSEASIASQNILWGHKEEIQKIKKTADFYSNLYSYYRKYEYNKITNEAEALTAIIKGYRECVKLAHNPDIIDEENKITEEFSKEYLNILQNRYFISDIESILGIDSRNTEEAVQAILLKREEEEEKERKRKEEEQKREEEERQKQRNIELRNTVPYIGMTADEVKKSAWGYPDKINRTTTQYGVSEQWVYKGPNYNYKYVYLDDGIVTAIQD